MSNCPPFSSLRLQHELSLTLRNVFFFHYYSPVCKTIKGLQGAVYCWHMVKIFGPVRFDLAIQPVSPTGTFYSRLSNNLPVLLTGKCDQQCIIIVLTVFYPSADFNLNSAGTTPSCSLTNKRGWRCADLVSMSRDH